MKMIVIILSDEDSNTVIQALEEAGFVVIKIDSTGGFLRQGSSTIMTGVPTEQVDQAIEIINNCFTLSIDPLARNATLFVLNIEHFEQIH
ncbi:MAG: cyclic-di-AMP receptor [Chloroflexi bacterium]|nr:cyclic-di-AMP receptor [Chloroflexota bacterium]